MKLIVTPRAQAQIDHQIVLHAPGKLHEPC